MKKKEFVFDVLVKRHTRCIHIIVENGEIVYAAECYSSTRKDIVKNPKTHDLSQNSPNWERLKKYIIWCWDADKKNFSKMFRSLNMNSQSYRLVKSLLNKRHCELMNEVDTILELIPLIDLNKRH